MINDMRMPIINFSLGVFFAFDNLYPFNHKNVNDTKKSIQKNAQDTIIKRLLACAGVISPSNALGF
jgi:hypothetical protein